MKLSKVQREALSSLQAVAERKRGAIPRDWPFWDKYDPRTLRALKQKGAISSTPDDEPQMVVVYGREGLAP